MFVSIAIELQENMHTMILSWIWMYHDNDIVKKFTNFGGKQIWISFRMAIKEIINIVFLTQIGL
jgi:hypothetical protein